ncbi:MAG: hypothetical protein GY723_17270 [bacterium]|nr:hypothetical protein [bacterium]
MIIYGTRATITAGQVLAQICPECEQPSLRGFQVFRYAHLYHVPTAPFGSRPGIECGSCFLTRVGSEIPEQLAAAAGAAIRELRRPRWHWAGSLLFALLIGWFSLESAREAEANLAHLANPVVGDLYVLDLRGETENVDPEMPFIVALVEAVVGDHVTVRMGRWLYDTAWDAQKAVIRDHPDEPDYWGSQHSSFERGQLQSLEAENKLHVARRAK